MGARALGVGALFVNVLLILAQDGSRSNLPPHPPLPAPAPPLLCQLWEGGERRHPASPAATAVRVSGSGATCSLLRILFKGRLQFYTLCSPWHAIVPAPREYWMRRKSSSSTRALSLELGARGAKQGPRGTGEKFVRVPRDR